MTPSIGTAARAPRSVTTFGSVFKAMLRAGVPLGPNGLITIRGRKSGIERTSAVAVIKLDGRRWVWCPWGDVNWVRNLRAAGEATLTVHRQSEAVRATELDDAQRLAFFRDVLGPLARGMRGGVWFIRTVDGVDITDPVKAADGRCVFELETAS
jgi:deazaflavin-dependent oxidoreductase (nitroreductase family)